VSGSKKPTGYARVEQRSMGAYPLHRLHVIGYTRVAKVMSIGGGFLSFSALSSQAEELKNQILERGKN
jgi:hypothetical protein